MNERLGTNSSEVETSGAERSRWDSLIEFGKTHVFKHRAEKAQPSRQDLAEEQKPKDEVLAELRQKIAESYDSPNPDGDESEKIQSNTLKHIGEDVEKISEQAEVERELNSRLITIDKIEAEIANGNSEVERLEDVEYNGKKIPVYNLKGLPFAMLNHTVDYRRPTYETGGKGSQTSQELLENPSFWTRSQTEAMQDDRYSENFRSDAIGNVISTSYLDAGNNLRSDVDGNGVTCKYGFSRVEDGGLLEITDQDNNTSNRYDYSELPTCNVSKLMQLSNVNGKKPYNEMVIRRYLENGEPKLPDYMITKTDMLKDGQIPEDTLRHASFFNIPIINIDTEAYDRKADKIATTTLEDISEESNYSELIVAANEIAATYKYSDSTNLLKQFGRGNSEKFLQEHRSYLDRQHYSEEVTEKLTQLERLEYEKRPDFIMNELNRATEACKKSTAEGKKYDFASDNLSSIRVTVYSPENNTKINETGSKNMDVYDTRDHVRYNEIAISMASKDGRRTIETNIYDGEQYRNAGNENPDDKDAGIYSNMLPLVQAYLTTRQENAAMTAQQ